MEQQFIEEKTFERKDFSENGLEKDDYEFHDCYLSMANLNQTGFQDVIQSYIKCCLLSFALNK